MTRLGGLLFGGLLILGAWLNFRLAPDDWKMSLFIGAVGTALAIAFYLIGVTHP